MDGDTADEAIVTSSMVSLPARHSERPSAVTSRYAAFQDDLLGMLQRSRDKHITKITKLISRVTYLISESAEHDKVVSLKRKILKEQHRLVDSNSEYLAKLGASVHTSQVQAEADVVLNNIQSCFKEIDVYTQEEVIDQASLAGSSISSSNLSSTTSSKLWKKREKAAIAQLKAEQAQAAAVALAQESQLEMDLQVAKRRLAIEKTVTEARNRAAIAKLEEDLAREEDASSTHSRHTHTHPPHAITSVPLPQSSLSFSPLTHEHKSLNPPYNLVSSHTSQYADQRIHCHSEMPSHLGDQLHTTIHYQPPLMSVPSSLFQTRPQDQIPCVTDSQIPQAIRPPNLPQANVLSPAARLRVEAKKAWASDPTLSVEPVDAWIDRLLPWVDSSDASMSGYTISDINLALLRGQEKQGLPVLVIPKFSGKSMEWPKFIERYRDNVHDKPSLTNRERMAWLLSLLAGEALQVAEAIGTSGPCYAVVLKALKREYGRPLEIASSCIKAVVNGPRVKEGDKEAIKELQRQLRSVVSCLVRSGQQSSLYSVEHLMKIVWRLPTSLRNRWNEILSHYNDSHDHPSLMELEYWLSQRIAVLNNAFTHYIDERDEQEKGRQKITSKPSQLQGSHSKPSQIRTFNSAVKNGPSSFPKTRSSSKTSQQAPRSQASQYVSSQNQGKQCPSCKNNHRLVYCPSFMNLDVNGRFDFIKLKNLCLNCLKDGHKANECPSTSRCRIESCGKSHHSLLHRPTVTQSAANPHQQDTSTIPTESTSTLLVSTSTVLPTADEPSITTHKIQCQQSTEKGVFLQVIPIRVKHGSQTVHTYALLDTGSDSTIIKQELAVKLNLQGSPKKLHLTTLHPSPTLLPSQQVSFQLLSRDTDESVTVNGAWVVPHLQVPGMKQSADSLKAEWPHLKDVPLRSYKESDVTVLIGADFPELHIPLELRQSDAGPTAIKTKLGWTLFGPAKRGNTSTYVHCNVLSAKNAIETLTQQLERFWEIDSYGTKTTQQSPSESMRSQDDKRALAILHSTIKKEDGHYQTGLLWKHDNPVMPYNFQQAAIMFLSSEKRLDKNPKLKKKYSEVINDYVSQGHVSRLTEEEAHERTAITYYIPHHGVTNPHKPGKLRVVFNAACKRAGTSLNEQLIPGPDLLNSLPGCLLRFREGYIGIMSDVKQMYHQVRVRSQDRDALRFIWRDSAGEDLQIFKANVHLFGKVDSPTCANFSLRQTAVDQKGIYDEDALLAISRNFYMDDLLAAKPDTDSAIRFADQVTKILASGGFKLTKWVSNSKAVLDSLPTSDVAINTVDLNLDTTVIQRALGVHWDIKEDSFCFKSLSPTGLDTKRGLLSTISSLFDPLGVLSPYVLKAKLLMQETWRRQIDWDSSLPPDILSDWTVWKAHLENVSSVKIPRWFGFHAIDAGDLQLHIFCDASEKAYGCVAFLRATLQNGEIIVRFIISKTRLAPLKILSIPRLELQAAVLGSRMYVTIIEESCLEFTRVVFWSDSQTTIQYLNNKTKRFNTFVAHRVEEITKLTSVEDWHHIPGKLNVADDCTRGLWLTELNLESRWIKGPPFLHQSEDMWPQEVVTAEETELELHPNQVYLHLSNSKGSVAFVDWNRFSTWRKYLRTYGFVQRFISKLKFRITKTPFPPHLCSKWLSMHELKDAKLLLCRLAQTEAYSLEVEALKCQKPLPNSSKLLPLQPILIDGILRVGGRIDRAPVAYEARHQIILPQNHTVAKLMIHDVHSSHAHIGREHTLSLLRQEFWVPQGRSLVRQVIHNCFRCKRERSTPKVPIMASLPKDRLAIHEVPFTYTGVDYFGPMYVKIGRSNAKRWGAIFTCLTTRAVHLELAGDLSTDAFIMALRRFCGRRTYPRTLRSDNGTNFVGADRELRLAFKQLNQSAISRQLAAHQTEWLFNPPAAPHFGGIYEVMVKLTKRAIRAISNQRVFREDALVTILVEVEAILNSRPLTPVSDDPSDFEALTPNHFLHGQASPNLSPGNFDSREIDSRKRWRQTQAVTNMFWNRFRKEYLPLLSTRSKWNHHQRSLQVGDLVLIHSDEAPRSHWPLGRVLKTFQGDGGHVRMAQVKTANNTLTRPVVKLSLLEESSS